MISIAPETTQALPELNVQVNVEDTPVRHGHRECRVGTDFKIVTKGLESYFFANWNPAVYDALLVAAAVEFCDRQLPRTAHVWGRSFNLIVPVHDLAHWQSDKVSMALQEVLQLLTGDRWSIEFCLRKNSAPRPRQKLFNLPMETAAVIPYSDGLDSLVVAGLMKEELCESLVRVRLGSGTSDTKSLSHKEPFMATPFKVRSPERGGETSFRSRGFKFLLLGGVAAYLAGAKRIILPESGQGALGPALITSGQAHPDYRNHPKFTRKLEHFINALLSTSVRFEQPQLWKTKGESLSAYLQVIDSDYNSWAKTRSCWQQSRHVSVQNKLRQCGICAACLLRRLSIYSAGLNEPNTNYVWENLSSSNFKSAVAKGFDHKKITPAMHEYAIAGALHLDQLASLRHSKAHALELQMSAAGLSESCDLPLEVVTKRLTRLLKQHESEWLNFMNSLGSNSFLSHWAPHANEHLFK